MIHNSPSFGFSNSVSNDVVVQVKFGIGPRKSCSFRGTPFSMTKLCSMQHATMTSHCSFNDLWLSNRKVPNLPFAIPKQRSTVILVPLCLLLNLLCLCRSLPLSLKGGIIVVVLAYAASPNK